MLLTTTSDQACASDLRVSPSNEKVITTPPWARGPEQSIHRRDITNDPTQLLWLCSSDFIHTLGRINMTTALLWSPTAHLGRKRGAATVPSSRAIAAPMRRLRVVAGNATPGDTVLIVGATGGVGQLTAAKLLEVRASEGATWPQSLSTPRSPRSLPCWRLLGCTHPPRCSPCCGYLRGRCPASLADKHT
jgi:hypothetical protein